MHRYGTVSSKGPVERTNYLRTFLASLRFNDQPSQIIAVRYSFTANNFYFKYFYRNPCLELKLQPTDDAYADLRAAIQFQRTQQSLLAGFFLLLAAFSLFLYFLISIEKFYLSLAIFCTSQFLQVLSQVAFSTDATTTEAFTFLFSGNLISLSGALMLLNGFYLLFNQPKRLFFYSLSGFALVTIPCLLFLYNWGATVTFCFILVLNMDVLRLCIGAARRHRSGAWTLIFTFSLFYLFFGAFVTLNAVGQIQLGYLISAISLFVPPLGMSLFLAGEFSRTNRTLVTKLIEVETLSAEKQQILSAQNETLERQVTERTTELNQSLIDLRTTQTQLIQKEKMASLGELTAGIAHEIQNPLNFVNNFSEVSTELTSELKQELSKGDLIEAQAIADDLTQNLQKITHHGNRASAIVKGMLEHSRTTTGESEPTNLNPLVEEYLRLAYQGFRAKDKAFSCQVKTDFDPKLGLADLVPQEIGRVLLNLFNNAFYAVGQRASAIGVEETYEPTVRVSTHQLDNAVVIRVGDNGTGIPDSVKSKIFQPFFTTKPTGEGTGLGLSLSYDIVTKGHGGTLRLESIEGNGATFLITLPTS